MGFLDNIGKAISDVGQTTIQKGKDIADVAKYNSLINDEEKKITSLYEQIGRRYVEEFGEKPAESMAEYLEALKTSKNTIAEYQQKLKDLKGISICPTCGAEVPNGSSFCAACGTKMAAPSVEPAKSGKVCSKCGAIVSEGNKFCTSCGQPMEQEASSSNEEKTTANEEKVTE